MSTEAADKTSDFLGMSDEDFLNATPPASDTTEGADSTSAAAADDTVVETPDSTVDTEEPKADADGNTEDTSADDAAKSGGDAAPGSAGDGSAAADPAKATEGKPEEAAAKAEPAKDDKAVTDPKAADAEGADKDTKDKSAEPAKTVDYEAFFQQVMKPFKANGKEIKLNTPEEAIRLMQMGAGYGRKIQDLQPALKTLKMLEKADLLDEGKLSFLIDINNKNPAAIKKLIKEAGIDPLDLNIEDNASYTPTSHAVSDKEMAFHSVVDDLTSDPVGQETLRVVNQTWDAQSKAALGENPEILTIIKSQRENGVYDQITAEIERQKILGQIPVTTPFLQAYKLAGEHLQASNGFKLAAPAAKEDPKAQPEVIATRAEAPKAQVQNSDKAKAAAPTKSSDTRRAGAKVNPLAMADDDFLKLPMFEGRL